MSSRFPHGTNPIPGDAPQPPDGIITLPREESQPRELYFPKLTRALDPLLLSFIATYVIDSVTRQGIVASSLASSHPCAKPAVSRVGVKKAAIVLTPDLYC